jgi:hypothetical protein
MFSFRFGGVSDDGARPVIVPWEHYRQFLADTSKGAVPTVPFAITYDCISTIREMRL